MEIEEKKFKKSGRAHLALGIILMFLGFFLIADITNLFDFRWRLRDFVFTWQALLIFLGVIFLSNRENRGVGLVLIAIGSFFLLDRFFDMPYYWRSLFWPSMLVLLGFVVIFGARRHPGRGKCFKSQKEFSGEDVLDDVAIFGGGDRMVNSQQFRGGKITHIFGGSKYNFSGAKLAPGENHLEVVFAFGGSKFIVPEDWDIKIEVTSVFGGFSDKRVRTLVEKDRSKTLVISGVNVFGGGEITNYL